MRKLNKACTLLLTALFLASCGGGSSNNWTPVETASTPPPPPPSGCTSNCGNDTTYYGDYSDAVEYIMQDGFYTQALVIYKDGELLREDYRDITGNEATAVITKQTALTEQQIQDYYAYNDEYDKTGTWSVTKSFMSILVGIAIDNGFIQSLEQRSDDFITEWYGRSQGQMVTIGHLLDHRSGLQVMCSNNYSSYEFFECQENPDGGTITYLHDQLFSCINRSLYPNASPPPFWNYDRDGSWKQQSHIYSNCDSQILGEILTRATGMDVSEFADRYLFSQLGIQDVSWWKDMVGNTLSYCCVEISAKDQAKIGQMILDNDGSIVSREFIDGIDTSTRYSRSFRNTEGWITMNGFDLNFILMHKEKNMVIVRSSLYASVTEYDGTRTINYQLGTPEWDSNFPASLPMGIAMEGVDVDMMGELISKID
jgi:CubicO group peptidase (beta-lactamase class C family)